MHYFPLTIISGLCIISLLTDFIMTFDELSRAFPLASKDTEVLSTLFQCEYTSFEQFY